VAALLYDIEGVEITSKVIRDAVGTLESGATSFTENTFHGRDLVRSLGPVLKDAMPLISSLEAADHESPLNIPIGSRIISCVREYSLLSGDEDGRGDASHDEAIEILQVQYSNSHADKNVVAALRKVGALRSDLCFHPATC
jgi:response regulator RpfG family c-di-GMP phosphodiesterase